MESAAATDTRKGASARSLTLRASLPTGDLTARVRNRDGVKRASTTTQAVRSSSSPSAYSRLYAQGVDLLEHKDEVFRLFGLRKVEKTDGAATIAVTSAARKTTTTRYAVETKRKPAPSVGVSTTTPSTGTAKARSRSPSITSYPSVGRRNSLMASQTLANTSTNMSEIVAGLAMSPRGYGKARIDPRQKSGGAVRTNGAARKAGASVRKGASSPKQSKPPSSAASSTSTPSKASSKAPYLPPPAPTKSLRRMASSPALTSTGQPSPRQAKSVETKDSMTSPLQRPTQSVFIEVSRKTSSPIYDASLRRRPSVSPIPSLLGHGDDFQGPHSAPKPGLVRRDSKVEKLMEQITVLKTSLGLSEEDLQWKVESSKGNAFLAADKHLAEAEERYDRLVYEIQLLTTTPCEEVSKVLIKQLKALVQQSQYIAELKPKLTNCQNEVARLKKLLMDARIAAELRQANTRSDMFNATSNETLSLAEQVERAKAELLDAQEQIKINMTKLNGMLTTLSEETETLSKACAEFRFMSAETEEVSNSLIHVLKCVPECSGEDLVSLCDQATQTAVRLCGSRIKELKRKEGELAKTTKDVEIWKYRRENAKEYAAEMAAQERQWKEDHLADNTAALRVMRSMVPHDVQLLTVEQIIERAQTLGVLYTYDLANYVKQNRFLHWLVTHETDITRDNLLAVECAHYFLNFTSYDIIELRALCRVLPESFEFDKEGKKLEWKMQFMDHVRTLVWQQLGETIKMGWDPVKRTRGEVQLKPLTERQLLNPIFKYPTEEEIQARIDKFETQLKRVKMRKDKLDQLVTTGIPTAKAEYLAVAEDARSEELQRSFGKATLIKLRDDAKQHYQSLCKTQVTLESEIKHSEKLMASASPTYEQYLEEVQKIRQLDKFARTSRIRGPFPEEIQLKPRERAAFKKLSVEEEAQARRQELDSAIAERDKELKDGSTPSDSTDTASASQPSIEGTAGEARTEPSADAEDTSNNPAAFRRVKSLRVAVGVLKFLEKDFCSPRRLGVATPVEPRPGMPKWKSARTIDERSLDATTVSGNGGEPAAPATPAVPARPKSKALQTLLEKNQSSDTTDSSSDTKDTTTATGPAVPVTKSGAPSFLAELQNRAKRSTPNSTESTTTTTPGGGGGKPNFLEELKRVAAKKESSSTPVNEQAKPGTEPTDVQRPVVRPAASINFLDELKMRAKNKAEPVAL
ncbi:TPA: hypothetical protein N0F65_004725 [Lagenidium giganteum]|uniref:Uncharacterized protein n=1 Tax=Lagenidium giganteum TaxID=4803 RepID=A0AAV2Z556_9STRA|nr:TPA: hypothetical protein N0F65_004725 [Lagenidium giganteum]